MKIGLVFFSLWVGLLPLAAAAPSAEEEAHYNKVMAAEAGMLKQLGAADLQKPWGAFTGALVNLRCSVQSGPGSASSDFLYWRAEMAGSSAEVIAGKTPYPNASKEIAAALKHFQRVSKNVPPIGSEPTIPKDLKAAEQAMKNLEKALKQHYAAEPHRAEAATQAAQNLYAQLLTRLNAFIGDD